MNIVTADNLSKWYGEVIGLNQFNAVIETGITGLVGPNGAGKTTLLRILTGLIHEDKGHVKVLGEPPWNNPLLNARIGYCPEHEMLYPWMTGIDFLVSMMKMHGFQKSESTKRAREALKIVGLNRDDSQRKIKGYSKGMRQKVKVAQAFIHNPELLILDEPLAGTDPMGRKTLAELIKKMAAEGTHIIVSSHVLYEIEGLTDQVVLIDDGRALATGHIHEIRGLIDQHPHTVNIATNDARRLGKTLMEEEIVLSVTLMDESHVAVKTHQPDKFYQRMPDIVVNGSYEVYEMFSPDDNLEAVFRYLVKK